MTDLVILIALLAVGYVFGQYLENSHYRSIRKREGNLNKIPAIATKKLPPEIFPCKTRLVTGSVVISVDYFKKFVAGLRYLIGGRVTSYESLIDRARREAILRMKESAEMIHASHVFNVKMETASISKGRRNAIGSVEVLAYGTAIITSPEFLSDTVDANEGLFVITRPKEKFGMLKGFAIFVGIMFGMVTLFLILSGIFFTGPQLDFQLRFNDNISINDSIVLYIEASNPHDEEVQFNSLIIPNSLFENFEILSTTPLLSEDNIYRDSESISWYLEYSIQPGETKIEEIVLNPFQPGTFQLEMEFCNEFYDCLIIERPITVLP